MKVSVFLCVALSWATLTFGRQIELDCSNGCPPTDPPTPTVYCPDSVRDQCSYSMCQEAVSVPFPGNCHKFCKCDHIGPVEFTCPDGLVFNNNLGVCDWTSSCVDDPAPPCTTTTPCPTTTTACATTTCTTKPPCATTPACTTKPPCTPTTVAPIVRCPECVSQSCTYDMCSLAKHLPYPGDCHKFCKCDHSGAVEFICPDGLYFNPDLEVCDWPANVNCDTCKNMPMCSSL